MQSKAFEEKIFSNKKDKQNTMYQTKLSPKRQKEGSFQITTVPL